MPSWAAGDSGDVDAVAELRELERGTTLGRALAFFDALPPVTVAEMLGSWRGSGVPTGHPLDGLLERFGWYGKRFDSADDGHPLLFAAADGTPYAVNPAFVPLVLLRRGGLARAPGLPWLFRRARPVLATTSPRARLRMVEYRGVVSAAMLYDDLPIVDVFRRADADTVVAVMDLRGLDRPFFFALRRQS